MRYTKDNVIGLDFETYGAVSLPDHGLDRYTSDDTFQALMARTCIKVGKDTYEKWSFDYTAGWDAPTTARLKEMIGDRFIAAHNAGFEKRVLSTLGLHYPHERFVDSAVIARAAGAGGHLEAAAPQLLGIDKMESGRNLIMLFSVPGHYQKVNGDMGFDPQIITDNILEWKQFGEYCDLDARLSLDIVLEWSHVLTEQEMGYSHITQRMNEVGWHVDLPLVEEMQRRYMANMEAELFRFRLQCDAKDLNLNSLPQLKAWCLERGVKATSFDEKNVASLLRRIKDRIASSSVVDPKIQGYDQVRALLETKQLLGGSSLKKLQVILDTVGEGDRLKDQYLHCGASRTLRTTGRSVQMQNLKRLHYPVDMAELADPDFEMNNTELAENLRQVFTSSDPSGELIVGDFSSVESRGLAYLAGEEWKLQAYRDGRGVYEELAAKIFGGYPTSVTKEQRTAGKVGELSCGYNAGGGAVQAFAKNMGIEMSEGEATKLVYDWRDACPKTVEWWQQLDNLIHSVVAGPIFHRTVNLPHDGLYLQMETYPAPESLVKQHPGARTLAVIIAKGDDVILTRYFHGVHERGRNIRFYKPSTLKGGDLWKSSYTDPKTKELRFYDIYGGKMAGILTQSFCREIFFRVLTTVDAWATKVGVDLVGQFHDEIVLDWVPGSRSLIETIGTLTSLMHQQGDFPSFPLGAEVKHDYRYIK